MWLNLWGYGEAGWDVPWGLNFSCFCPMFPLGQAWSQRNPWSGWTRRRTSEYLGHMWGQALCCGHRNCRQHCYSSWLSYHHLQLFSSGSLSIVPSIHRALLCSCVTSDRSGTLFKSACVVHSLTFQCLLASLWFFCSQQLPETPRNPWQHLAAPVPSGYFSIPNSTQQLLKQPQKPTASPAASNTSSSSRHLQ